MYLLLIACTSYLTYCESWSNVIVSNVLICACIWTKALKFTSLFYNLFSRSQTPYVFALFLAIYCTWNDKYSYDNDILYSFQEINLCSSSPCQNGGTCNHLQDKFVCDCVAGYEGETCERGWYYLRKSIPLPSKSRPTKFCTWPFFFSRFTYSISCWYHERA